MYKNFFIGIGTFESKKTCEPCMKNSKTMRAKGIILMFIAGILVFTQFHLVSGWNSGDILTSSPSNTPTLDGVLGDDWRGPNINNSFHNLPGNIPINLYVLHNGSAIYFAIHVRFNTSINDESLILYFSKNGSVNEDDLFDRKAVFVTNASGSENASIVNKKDFYRNPDAESSDLWLEDTETIKWNVSVGKDERGYRVYEFQIGLSPEKDSENVKMIVGNQYTIVVSFAQNHDLQDEKKSAPLILQVGPKGLAGNDEIGEFKIDKEKFIQVTEIVLAVIFGLFGVLLIATKSKVGSLSIREPEMESSDQEEEEEEKEEEEKKEEKKPKKQDTAKQEPTAKNETDSKKVKTEKKGGK